MDKNPSEVVVYSRVGCHLCDEAKLILEKHGLAVLTIDIDQDSGLATRYGQCVPVVVIDGCERFRGRIDEVHLRRLLHKRTGP